MSGFIEAKVTSVQHWNDTLFSFRTNRDAAFRFKNGHFIMMGLPQEGRPLMRAYSIASANYEDELEFFSIKVPDGALTSQLKNVVVGDTILLSKKPTGTLLQDNLLPGKNLYLLSTGTGLAPFLSIIKDPEIYENFDKVIITHGVRYVSELAYSDTICHQLPKDEFLGEAISQQLIYYPTVTREPYKNQGRLTDLFKSGKLFSDIGMPSFNVESDRFMICGSPAMLKDCCQLLDEKGFKESRQGQKGQYVIERAFVDS
ncbi:ferredoxin--NADP(+) reductase [Gammaproteobacteria bacterium 53_120_T64]|nr:ferredoxin--NADP(+) reductase [Gammaproteobacteria bacterium 53_120_T64]